jgi:cobalt-zinc-cadmium efflux system outer membrane protein
VRIVCFAVVALVTARAHGQPARRPVALAEVIAALPRAPAAAIPQHEAAAADALVDAASAWPNPSLHVATNRLTARLVVGATVPLPIFGTIAAQRRLAAADAELVHAEGTVALRELRHRAVAAWIALARADGEVVATQLAARQAAELEAIARGRLAADVGAEIDATVAHAARARADVEVAAAERADDAASAELAGVLGWDPAQRLRADGTPPAGDASELAALRVRLDAHPERAAALRRIAQADASAAQIATLKRPSLAVEAEIDLVDPTLTDTSGNLIGPDAHVGVILELPVFAKIGDRVRAARATAAAQRARLATTDAQLGAALVAAYERWQAARARLHELETTVAPAQERAAKLAAQAYKEGARDLAYALQAERDFAAVSAAINEARADAALAFAELQLAVGDDAGGERAP